MQEHNKSLFSFQSNNYLVNIQISTPRFFFLKFILLKERKNKNLMGKVVNQLKEYSITTDRNSRLPMLKSQMWRFCCPSPLSHSQCNMVPCDFPHRGTFSLFHLLPNPNYRANYLGTSIFPGKLLVRFIIQSLNLSTPKTSGTLTNIV